MSIVNLCLQTGLHIDMSVATVGLQMHFEGRNGAVKDSEVAVAAV